METSKKLFLFHETERSYISGSSFPCSKKLKKLLLFQNEHIKPQKQTKNLL